ncbi:hypothetical protein [Streptomyces flaveolus]|uniref:hypothetical protein n=1 Tax=Streptomyces flaveolus TaxID=67297 RepID=UPI00332D4C8B
MTLGGSGVCFPVPVSGCWTGHAVEYHRAQIRGHLGFRECSVADAEKLTAYLAEHVADRNAGPSKFGLELLVRCREESIEPPTPGRCDRIVGAALRAAEESLAALISSRLTVESTEHDDRPPSQMRVEDARASRPSP